MKIRKTLLLSLIIFFSTNLLSQKANTIKINLANFSDEQIYLCFYYGDKMYVADSASLINGVYAFCPQKKYESGMYFIFNQNKEKLFEILIDNNYTDFQIYADIKNILLSFSAKKSKINSAFYSYVNYINKKENEVKAFVNSLSETDTSSVIQREIQNIHRQVENYIREVIKTNNDNVLGLILKSELPVKMPMTTLSQEDAYFEYLSNFLDNFAVDDERLLRTPLYKQKIDIFLDEITYQSPKYIVISIDKLISRVKHSQQVVKYLLWYITCKYENSNIMGFDAIFVHIVDKYYASKFDTWTQASTRNALINKADALKKTLIDSIAPNIRLLNQDKVMVDLYSVSNPYIIVLFWDDNCSTCLKHISFLSDVYGELKNIYGLEIFGVYTGENIEKMKEFINNKDINWINVYLYSNTEVDYAEMYNYETTPHYLLIDKDKKIIAKNYKETYLLEILEWHKKKTDKNMR